MEGEIKLEGISLSSITDINFHRDVNDARNAIESLLEELIEAIED